MTDITTFLATKNVADEIGIDLKPPLQAQRQINRANPQAQDPEQYFKVTVYIPYLDSLVSSLETKFSEETNQAIVFFPFILLGCLN